MAWANLNHVAHMAHDYESWILHKVIHHIGAVVHGGFSLPGGS